jgi:hypothetical protein
MPTGFTAAVQSGEIMTLRDFALSCARGMGALITMRDSPLSDPIPERFEVAAYYAQRAADADAELSRWLSVSVKDAGVIAFEEYTASVAAQQRQVDTSNAQNGRYKAMLVKVDEWRTDASGIREFMLEQLRSSMTFDGSFGDNGGKIELKQPAEFLRLKIADAEQEAARAAKSLAEERERVASRNRWLSDLFASLPPAALPPQDHRNGR